MRLDDQENGILKLVEACNERTISDHRDRLLIHLAASTGLQIGFLSKLRLWQLTYFFFLDKNDTARTPQRFDLDSEHPAPYTRIGFYADDDYRRITPVPRPVWKILKGYAGLFEDVEDRSSYLFPVIRKKTTLRTKKEYP